MWQVCNDILRSLSPLSSRLEQWSFILWYFSNFNIFKQYFERISETVIKFLLPHIAPEFSSLLTTSYPIILNTSNLQPYIHPVCTFLAVSNMDGVDEHYMTILVNTKHHHASKVHGWPRKTKGWTNLKNI